MPVLSAVLRGSIWRPACLERAGCSVAAQCNQKFQNCHDFRGFCGSDGISLRTFCPISLIDDIFMAVMIKFFETGQGCALTALHWKFSQIFQCTYSCSILERLTVLIRRGEPAESDLSATGTSARLAGKFLCIYFISNIDLFE